MTMWRDMRELGRMLHHTCNPRSRFVRKLEKYGCRLRKGRKWFVDISTLPYKEYGITFNEWCENAMYFVPLSEWARARGISRFAAIRLVRQGVLPAIQILERYYVYASAEAKMREGVSVEDLLDNMWKVIKRRARRVPSFVRLGVSHLAARKGAVLTALARKGILYQIGKRYFVWYDELGRDPLELLKNDPALLPALLPYPSTQKAVKEGRYSINKIAF